jgi:hypothetical protein
MLRDSIVIVSTWRLRSASTSVAVSSAVASWGRIASRSRSQRAC